MKKRAVVKGEGGFTLPEMMVTMMLMIVVMFALYSIFDASIRVFSFGNDKVESVESARVAMERMEREIRSAHPRNKAAGDGTVIYDFVAGPRARIIFGNDLNKDRVVQGSEQITYGVSTSAPYRLQRTAGSAGSPETLAEPLRNDGLNFTYLRSDGSTPAATEAQAAIVRVRITVDVRGRVQTLETDVALRNRGV